MRGEASSLRRRLVGIWYWPSVKVGHSFVIDSDVHKRRLLANIRLASSNTASVTWEIAYSLALKKATHLELIPICKIGVSSPILDHTPVSPVSPYSSIYHKYIL